MPERCWIGAVSDDLIAASSSRSILLAAVRPCHSCDNPNVVSGLFGSRHEVVVP